MQIHVNGEPRVVATAISIAELLAELDLATERVAVERNEVLVPRRLHAETHLAEGDRVEVVTLVGGG